MRFSILRIAWRNLGRNRRRTALAISAIALGQLSLVFMNCFMAGSFRDTLSIFTGPLLGHVQIFHRDWDEERASDLFVDRLGEIKAELRSLPQVKNIFPRIYSPMLSASGEKTDEPATGEPAMVVGVDVDAERGKGGMLENMLLEGAQGEGGVFVGQVLANRLGLKAGQQIALIGNDSAGFPVTELFKIQAVIDNKLDLVKSMGVVMALKDAGGFLLMSDQAHEIVVTGEDYRNAGMLASDIGKLPALEGLKIQSWEQAAPEIVTITKLKTLMDFIFLVIFFIAAAAGIANTAIMSTFERTREFGMLLAIGSRPDRIVKMVLVESVMLGLAGVAIGSLLGSALVLWTSHTGINYAALGGVKAQSISFGGACISYIIYPVFEIRHIVYGFIAVTFTSILASVWPAAISARLEPVEAMRS